MKKFLNLDFKQNVVLKYLNKLTYLAFFAFIFSACETESFDQPTQSPEQILKEQFSFDTFQDSPGLSKDNFIINWDSHITKKINTFIYYEFDIDIKYRSQLNLEDYASTHTYHLIARFDEDNNPEYYISKQLPLKTNTQLDVSYINMVNYSGMAYLYTDTGQKFSIEFYENGDIKGQWVEEELQHNPVVRSGDGCTIPFLRFSDLAENEQLPNRCSGGGCYTGTKTIQHWTYWYDVEVDNNTGVIVSATYSHRELTGTTTEHYHVCGGGSTAVTALSNTSRPTTLPDSIQNTEGADWPYPDCSSWEYANIGLVKVAAVSGIFERFYSYKVDGNGVQVKVAAVDNPTLYFTTPNFWTNGRAATLTATAMLAAQTATEAWFYANPDASAMQVGGIWLQNMKSEMGSIGGSVSTNNLNNFTSTPSTYKRNIFAIGNCG